MSVDQHLARAAQAQRQGRRDEVLREAQAALALRADHPGANNILGVEALAADDAATALVYFEAATKSDPRAAALWINLAKAHRLLGDDVGERSALQAALETDQRNLMGLVRLAQLHERRCEHGDATIRWAGVAALAAHHQSPSPELEAMFDHARAFLAARSARLSAAIDDDLGPDLANGSPCDQRRERAAIDHMLGRREIYTNACHGMNYPFLPADEYLDRDHFPWLAELEAQTAIIRAEAVALLASADPGLSPYVTMPPGTPDNLWSELNNNAAWSALHLWLDGDRVDGACARAPKTAEIVAGLPLAGIPGRAPTVFFSILQAGKHIPPHTGVTNTRTIIHLPLVIPPGCKFRVGGETREWHEGQAFAFDDTIEHEAWNPSDEDRVLLILDCWNPHLSEHERAMIARLFALADAQKDA